MVKPVSTVNNTQPNKNHTVRNSSIASAGTVATTVGSGLIAGNIIAAKKGLKVAPAGQMILGIGLLTTTATAIAAGVGALIGVIIKAIESKSSNK